MPYTSLVDSVPAPRSRTKRPGHHAGPQWCRSVPLRKLARSRQVPPNRLAADTAGRVPGRGQRLAEAGVVILSAPLTALTAKH